ncbi:MAG TPA: DUF488 domain-containing protein [Coriobacteriia bacterium]|nr:DUF488 domain-containing protein [Coriobacteriia bacterium]
MRIFTIGYEGWGFDLWADELLANGVQTVVDVRELPLSRRPGWSKRSLAEKLAERGLGYVHMRALGTPAPLRHGLRDGSLPFHEFAPQFRAMLDDRAEELDALLHLARTQTVVLMCWEEDPAKCHRSLVVEALGERADEPLDVVDIRRIAP